MGAREFVWSDDWTPPISAATVVLMCAVLAGCSSSRTAGTCETEEADILTELTGVAETTMAEAKASFDAYRSCEDTGQPDPAAIADVLEWRETRDARIYLTDQGWSDDGSRYLVSPNEMYRAQLIRAREPDGPEYMQVYFSLAD